MVFTGNKNEASSSDASFFPVFSSIRTEHRGDFSFIHNSTLSLTHPLLPYNGGEKNCRAHLVRAFEMMPQTFARANRIQSRRRLIQESTFGRCMHRLAELPSLRIIRGKSSTRASACSRRFKK